MNQDLKLFVQATFIAAVLITISKPKLCPACFLPKCLGTVEVVLLNKQKTIEVGVGNIKRLGGLPYDSIAMVFVHERHLMFFLPNGAGLKDSKDGILDQEPILIKGAQWSLTSFLTPRVHHLLRFSERIAVNYLHPVQVKSNVISCSLCFRNFYLKLAHEQHDRNLLEQWSEMNFNEFKHKYLCSCDGAIARKLKKVAQVANQFEDEERRIRLMHWAACYLNSDCNSEARKNCLRCKQYEQSDCSDLVEDIEESCN